MKDLKLLSLLCVCFLVCTLILNPCVIYASISTASGSNAVMMMSSSSRSGLASVNNTVDYDSVDMFIRLIDVESGTYKYVQIAVSDSGRYSYTVPSGYVLDSYGPIINKGALPVAGNYRLQVDVTSDVSLDYTTFSYVSRRLINNASPQDFSSAVKSYVQQYSGDWYLDCIVNFGSLSFMRVSARLSETLSAGSIIAGYVDIAFTRTDDVADIDDGTSGTTSSEYDDQVTSSLDDISSSVESVEEEISFVTQAIQTLQGAMEPHYDNVLTQLHHITEQLHAFYDQVYNNIHLPELAKMDEIIDAISNIDIEFQIDFDELKSSINNMSMAVQNKLQSTTDQITGGFDNAQQVTQNEQLSGAIDEYDLIESDVFEDATGFMGELEYTDIDSMSSGIIKALAFIGGFLQSIFICMGDFSVIITFSLTMIFVMIVIGYHRIRS